MPSEQSIWNPQSALQFLGTRIHFYKHIDTRYNNQLMLQSQPAIVEGTILAPSTLYLCSFHRLILRISSLVIYPFVYPSFQRSNARSYLETWQQSNENGVSILYTYISSQNLCKLMSCITVAFDWSYPIIVFGRFVIS